MEFYKLDCARELAQPALARGAVLLNTGAPFYVIDQLQAVDVPSRQRQGGLCLVGSKRHFRHIESAHTLFMPLAHEAF